MRFEVVSAKVFEKKVTWHRVHAFQASKVPKFCIEGTFDSGICKVNQPFTGEIFVKESAVDIKSVRSSRCCCFVAVAAASFLR